MIDIDYPPIPGEESVECDDEMATESRRKRVLLSTLSRLKKDHARAKVVARKILRKSSNQHTDEEDYQ